MRYNRVGDLASGVAGGVLAVNRHRIGTGGGPKWQTPGRLLANAEVNGWGLYAFSPPDWTPELVSSRGATIIGAGRGNFIATLRSTPPVTYGTIDGAPFLDDPAHSIIVDGAEDGGLLAVLSDGSALLARWPDGVIEQWPVSPHVSFGNCRIAAGAVVYLEEPATLWYQPRGGPRVAIPTVDTPFEPMVFWDRQGTRWFLYHNLATYLQRDTDAIGYQFEASYSPDVWMAANQTAEIALTDSPGELPETIHLVRFTLGVGMQPLRTPIIYPVVPPWPRACYLAPFKDPQGTAGANTEVAIDGALPGVQRPCWVGMGPNGDTRAIDVVAARGQLLGIIAEGLAGFDVVRHIADRLKTRIAWWKDGPDPSPFPAPLYPWDQIWAEWYVFREHGETLPQACDRWRHELDLALATECHDLGGIPQYYTRGLCSDQETIDIIAAGLALARGVPRLLTVAPFEYQRENGIMGNPAIREMYDRTKAAIGPMRPYLVPAWPSPPPVPQSSLLVLT